ncbi:hypothetical protein PHYBOEH_005568 [Phytophthora boehmeriae]|uniref:Bifunctional dihydrofolate reductase-thymidylate synthase n=1 Tax=Phytophthora boehmeriae TaxID=109152 RepID=A0A8T1WNW8_9STRA|nr:hypothetical protein PHYBOEH_005568 [Phytophthora boehmeriae]
MDAQGGIGLHQQIPWNIPGDPAHFYKMTTYTPKPQMRNVVIMGRKTWESLPDKACPLPKRLNIILSRNPSYGQELPSDVKVTSSLHQAVNLARHDATVDRIIIIGGSAVYAEALCYEDCLMVHFSPSVSFEDPTSAHEEQQYLKLIRRILDQGVEREDRTGIGTRSVFGAHMRFSLRNNAFPLLTTKRVFWRGVAEELLWFISGDTNARTLQQKGIHIWDGNGSSEFLDSRGLHSREVGDLGPVYGFQWRHFGAKYTDMHADYSGQGIDQLAEVIRQLRESPTDRRIVLSAWNPTDLDAMALPPCHMFCQFYVARGELSCQVYQRSADMGLGVPFNIASYALLTRLVAQVTGMLSGELIHVIGDAHVYINHMKPLRQQLARAPRSFPTLRIKPGITSIDDFTFSDFELIDYQPHSAIRMEMAV